MPPLPRTAPRRAPGSKRGVAYTAGASGLRELPSPGRSGPVRSGSPRGVPRCGGCGSGTSKQRRAPPPRSSTGRRFGVSCRLAPGACPAAAEEQGRALPSSRSRPPRRPRRGRLGRAAPPRGAAGVSRVPARLRPPARHPAVILIPAGARTGRRRPGCRRNAAVTQRQERSARPGAQRPANQRARDVNKPAGQRRARPRCPPRPRPPPPAPAARYNRPPGAAARPRSSRLLTSLDFSSPLLAPPPRPE